jgi:hypothetical protein
LTSSEIARYSIGYSYYSLHNRDSNILKDIQEKLGVGIIYEYKNKFNCRLAINKKSDLLYLINNVFDKYPLVTKNQSIRYHLLKNGIINNMIKFKTLREYQDYKINSLSYFIDQANLQNNNNKFENFNIDN